MISAEGWDNVSFHISRQLQMVPNSKCTDTGICEHDASTIKAVQLEDCTNKKSEVSKLAIDDQMNMHVSVIESNMKNLACLKITNQHLKEENERLKERLSTQAIVYVGYKDRLKKLSNDTPEIIEQILSEEDENNDPTNQNLVNSNSKNSSNYNRKRLLGKKSPVIEPELILSPLPTKTNYTSLTGIGSTSNTSSTSKLSPTPKAGPSNVKWYKNNQYYDQDSNTHWNPDEHATSVTSANQEIFNPASTGYQSHSRSQQSCEKIFYDEGVDILFPSARALADLQEMKNTKIGPEDHIFGVKNVFLPDSVTTSLENKDGGSNIANDNDQREAKDTLSKLPFFKIPGVPTSIEREILGEDSGENSFEQFTGIDTTVFEGENEL